MNNILKKLSVLMVLFVFMGLFSVVASATEGTKADNANDNVTITKDEYNDLKKELKN